MSIITPKRITRLVGVRGATFKALNRAKDQAAEIAVSVTSKTAALPTIWYPKGSEYLEPLKKSKDACTRIYKVIIPPGKILAGKIPEKVGYRYYSLECFSGTVFSGIDKHRYFGQKTESPIHVL